MYIHKYRKHEKKFIKREESYFFLIISTQKERNNIVGFSKPPCYCSY